MKVSAILGIPPTIPITLLKNGQFYAMGLTPARYRLIIANAYNKIVRTIELKSGETLNIGQFSI